jgi:KDO2-lipid IV(A) lauroyltransferase
LKLLLPAIKTMVSHIPFPVLGITGKALGWVAFAVDKRHRLVVKRNLSFIFPDFSQDRIHELTLRVFQNTGITLLEILQFIFSSEAQIAKRVEIHDPGKHIETLKSKGRLILISAHMGNWEIPPLFWSMHFKKPLLLVARPLDNPLLNRWIMEFRTRYGSTVVEKRGAIHKLARGLRDHQPVGMLIDQDIRPSEAIKVDFLGKAVNSTPSVAWLARRYDCLVVPVFCSRNPDGKLIMEINAPLDLVRSNQPKEDILVNTRIINDSVSRAVLKNVDQWFWFHKRWKRYYPDLYPEENKRLQRLESKKAKTG